MLKQSKWWAVRAIQSGRISPRMFLSVGETHSKTLAFCKGMDNQPLTHIQHQTTNTTAFSMLAPSNLGAWK